MSDRPIRLRLSRARGFNLQAHSIAANGLPAVNVSRPSRWGNFAAVRTGCLHGKQAVSAFEAWIATEASDAWKGRLPIDLGRRNLACWCRLDAPCHADVLLDLANRPVCDDTLAPADALDIEGAA